MKTYIVDSFTNNPFKGNPAGVCILETKLADDRMLQIAQELNLSETAFILPFEEMGIFTIRYFSPKMEIPLCGHATLASAKVLFSTTQLKEVKFVNIQNITLDAYESDGQISMNFPVYETHPSEAPSALLAALGIRAVENVAYNKETEILMIEISDQSELDNLAPDFESLYKSHDSIKGVLVTAAGSDGYDFHSRYFWPWSGTNEDPVTGGTHTFLAKYWSNKLNKTKMKSFQSSKRTGFMEVELIDGKVLIRSQAVIVFEGQMVV